MKNNANIRGFAAKKVAIIGAGASGIACAVRLSQLSRLSEQAFEVTLFESGKHIGRPILQSGNGRCNFSNAQLDLNKYHNGSFVREALSFLDENWDYSDSEDIHQFICSHNSLDKITFQNAVISWFETLGLVWTKQENESLLYPESNKASTVLEVLENSLQAKIYLETKIVSVEHLGDEEQYLLTDHQGMSYRFDYCIVASGGKTPQSLLSEFDLPFISQEPVLCPIEIKREKALAPYFSKAKKKDPQKSLSGIRIKANVVLKGKNSYCEVGEVLFREYGLSGIAVFNVSRYALSGDTLILELFPEYSASELMYLLLNRYQAGSTTLARLTSGLLLPQVASFLFGKDALDSECVLKEKDLGCIVEKLKNISFTVSKNRDDQSCQLHRGGINPACLSFQSLEVSHYPGLYVLGEAIDVDGPCGGYNLHWAFSTGLLAAQNISRKEYEESK